MPFDPLTMLGVAGGALAATGIASDLGNLGINFLNYKEQQATRVQNERLMREAWARDDSARQRMVTDLEKAGLSKWLASGASPMTSSPVSLNAPQMGEVSMDALQHSFENALNYQQTKTQSDLADSQGALADASTAVAEAEKKIKEEELNIKKQEFRIKQHDANVWTNRPSVASNDPAPMRYIVEGGNLIQGSSDAGNQFAGWLNDKLKGNDTITESSKPVPTPKSATLPQQKQIQKLKGKQAKSDSKKGTTDDIFHPKFQNYQDWLASTGTSKFYYEKHPKEAWKAYEAYLKRLK